ncbi:MarR family winged helix-turn-helix transcriptional regulator [Streptomyces sp. NPDC060194]|uniref:MarR family winged helix-turn-helix transcriptional regulator n=1 Tax=Streptomyces sp. NPDC060194 TaxID=3347069 RepID=UPI0036627386
MASADALSRSALAVLHLHARFTAELNRLTLDAGLTAAQWQILHAIRAEPRSVSAVARLLGLTRQSVQRVADLLVGRGLAGYRDNPAHRRARLLAATEAGAAVLRGIDPGHTELARRLCGELGGAEEFRRVTGVLGELSRALAAVAPHAAPDPHERP